YSLSDVVARQSVSGSYAIVATYKSGWSVSGQTETTSSLHSSTRATPGFGNVSTGGTVGARARLLPLAAAAGASPDAAVGPDVAISVVDYHPAGEPIRVGTGRVEP